MTAPDGSDLPRDEQTRTERAQAPLDLVPGLAEDFAAAGAAFVAACIHLSSDSLPTGRIPR
jgi:hypothetical protein